MKTKEFTLNNCNIQTPHSMISVKIRQALIEADAREFATESEVKAFFEKWKVKSNFIGSKK